jgi:ABC-type glycerol-3-phosphate transport system permease component
MAKQRTFKPINWGNIATYIILIIGAIFALTPFVWMISWSFMVSDADITVCKFFPTRLIPENINAAIANPEAHITQDGRDFNLLRDYILGNYTTVWEDAEFARYMWNSVRLTGITISGLLLFCIPAAYAFARMSFYGKNTLFAMMLASLMIPDIVTLIPNFLTVIWISRLSDTVFGIPWMANWPGLTVPFMASAFAIFLLRQFFSQIPEDLWDAARIDGASHIQFLLRVVLPLSKAPIMTVVTFAFIGAWNSLLWPLLISPTNKDWMPIALALANFVQTEAGDEFHWQMAGSVLMILPILLLYFFTQRQFTEGIYSGSLKG